MLVQKQAGEKDPEYTEEEKQQLIDKRDEKEMMLRLVAQDRDKQAFIRRELSLVKREERLDNVERIARANKYAAAKIKKKIESDMQRSNRLEAQKQEIMEQRRKVKHKLNAEKDQLMKAVEEMKRTGNFTRSKLAQYGLADPV